MCVNQSHGRRDMQCFRTETLFWVGNTFRMPFAMISFNAQTVTLALLLYVRAQRRSVYHV